MATGAKFWDGSSNWASAPDEQNLDARWIAGEVPEAMRGGLFLRNGANQQFKPLQNYHLFEGDGMVHGVYFQADGTVAYVNRYVQTKDYLAEKTAGKSLFWSFLDFQGPLGMVSMLWNVVGRRKLGMRHGAGKFSANTAVVYHDRRLLALVEAAPPTQLHARTLDTLGLFTYNGELRHAMTAHPKLDYETGELLFFGYAVDKPPYLTYRTVTVDGQISAPVEIDIGTPLMIHDFACSATHTVFLCLPMVFDPKRVIQRKPVFMFEPERYPSRFGVLRRHAQPGDEPQWFDVRPCYVFHVANAFDDGDEVVVVAARHETIRVMELGTPMDDDDDDDDGGGDDYDREGRVEKTGLLWEWRLNRKTGAVVERQLSNNFVDFPVINNKLAGRPTRYVYAAVGALADGPKQNLFNGFIGVAKYDVQTGQELALHVVDGRFGGEWVFVPRPGASDEDDGWLVSYVYCVDPKFPRDINKSTSELEILSAKDLSSVCRLQIPSRIPFGFHGCWLTQQQLETARSSL